MKPKDRSAPALGAQPRRPSGIQMQRTLCLSCDCPRATTSTASIFRHALFGHRLNWRLQETACEDIVFNSCIEGRPSHAFLLKVERHIACLPAPQNHVDRFIERTHSLGTYSIWQEVFIRKMGFSLRPVLFESVLPPTVVGLGSVIYRTL
jgi:hypothetical protein